MCCRLHAFALIAVRRYALQVATSLKNRQTVRVSHTFTRAEVRVTTSACSRSWAGYVRSLVRFCPDPCTLVRAPSRHFFVQSSHRPRPPAPLHPTFTPAVLPVTTSACSRLWPGYVLSLARFCPDRCTQVRAAGRHFFEKSANCACVPHVHSSRSPRDYQRLLAFVGRVCAVACTLLP